MTIPHDAMQWDPKSADSPSGVNSGWYSARDYLYTKHFSSADIRRSSGDLTLLEFEGVYRNARIRLNGRLIASHDYGYSGFYADLSEYIAEGDNVLTVEAHNSDQPNCRWYSGTGIYRPVWLCVMPERPYHARRRAHNDGRLPYQTHRGRRTHQPSGSRICERS